MKKILIVDDNSNNRYYLEQLLKGGGFETASAVNGEEALKMASEKRPDVIISDILMPVMDGFELCRRIKADSKLWQIPIIIYTATYTEPEDEKLALDLGADMFIVKPKQPEELLKAVGEMLRRGVGGGKELHPGKDMENRLALLDQYNKTLFHKLEQKIQDLEGEVLKRTKTEEKLSLTVAALKKSNAELQKFTNAASHDLQEPLRMVSSYVQLLKKKYTGKLDNEAESYIETAVMGSVRMSELIKGMIEYLDVDLKAREAETCDMNEAADAAVVDYSLQLHEKGGSISRDTLLPVKGEKDKIIRVIGSLIDNAIRFSRKGAAPAIHISCESEGNAVKFGVKDNGIGVPAKYFNKIFIIFQKLHPKDEYGGNGMGLAICKKLIEGMGGDMWVESEEGKGSEFFFTLPAA